MGGEIYSGLAMPPEYVDISKYWDREVPVNQIWKRTIEKGREVDRKTLTLALNGDLKRCSIKILWRLLLVARDLSGNNNLNLEDILKDSEEDND